METTNTAQATKTVTLPLGKDWYCCRHSAQFEGRTGRFTVTLRHFEIVCGVYNDNEEPGFLHGDWATLEEAQWFAKTMGDGRRSYARRVPAYWYESFFGVVEAADEAVAALVQEAA